MEGLATGAVTSSGRGLAADGRTEAVTSNALTADGRTEVVTSSGTTSNGRGLAVDDSSIIAPTAQRPASDVAISARAISHNTRSG
jgi:hypothetical protein